METSKKMKDDLPVLKLREEAILPTRAHADDAGLDLYSVESATLLPGTSGFLGTGVAVAIPPSFVGLIADRSSLAKKGLMISGGVIDSGYRGEIKVILWNISKEPIELRKGERIAQLLLVPVITSAVRQVEILDQTARNQKGFGSTGN